MKAFAINTVHVCRAPGEKSPEGKVTKPANIEVVPAGAVFDVDKAQFDDFKKLGAVRAATKADIAASEDGGLV